MTTNPDGVREKRRLRAARRPQSGLGSRGARAETVKACQRKGVV